MGMRVGWETLTMQKSVLMAVAGILPLLTARCVQESKPPGTDHAARPASTVAIVRVKGSDAMKPLLAELGTNFSKSNRVRVQVDGGGTAAGLAALADGTADLADASRAVSPQERQVIESKRGGSLVETPLAFDTVALYVNEANPVTQLSMKQLAGILSGSISNWKQLGGPNAAINIYGATGSELAPLVGLTSASAPNQKTLPDMRQVLLNVAADGAGLGYAGLGRMDNTRVVWISKEDGGISAAPTEKSVHEWSYPLSARLYIESLSNSPEPVRHFVAWAGSPSASKAYKTLGYVQEPQK
jgi:phosphate transport system substrate-binding protein